MKLARIYERVLREGEAQSCIAKFGNVLFGDQLGGKEKNTNIEDKYLGNLHSFTDDEFGEDITPEIKKAIVGLANCVNTYPDVLRPNSGNVFRGASSPLINFIKRGKLPTYNETAELTYKGRGYIQSWTEVESAAEIFGDAFELDRITMEYDFSDSTLNEIIDIIGNVRIPIILVSHTDKGNFIFKGDVLDDLSEFSTEYEVIRIGNEPMECKAYLNDKYLSKDSRELLRIIQNHLQNNM